MDNVISFEVVLPNATVTTASATKNADLFWGLKGGFNNFGIVTSAVVKAFPLGSVYVCCESALECLRAGADHLIAGWRACLLWEFTCIASRCDAEVLVDASRLEPSREGRYRSCIQGCPGLCSRCHLASLLQCGCTIMSSATWTLVYVLYRVPRLQATSLLLSTASPSTRLAWVSTRTPT